MPVMVLVMIMYKLYIEHCNIENVTKVVVVEYHSDKHWLEVIISSSHAP